MKPVTLLIVGAGDRGMNAYATYTLRHPDRGRVVAVAEPSDVLRRRAAEKFNVPADGLFKDWREVADKPRLADAALICTQDREHVGPAVAFLDKGYHVLLEKPMAVTEEDCRTIVVAAKRSKGMFGVCHVLRYTSYTRKMKSLLDSGAVGDIVTIRHIEPVGWWHQAHSFVRGNWGNSERASSMLLAKSCHDMDYLRCLVGKRCLRVASFGSLKHFRPENKPSGAADRCTECSPDVEKSCPYSALRIYETRDPAYWPVSVITTDHTPEGVRKALESGPYGRCVYACDNDVVDHQVVVLEFEGGATATFTMTAFTGFMGRETHIMGTRGTLRGDGRRIKRFSFVTEKETTYDTHQDAGNGILSGHGGGDEGIIHAFIDAVAHNDPSRITTGPDETLESHLITFAAERARMKGTVEEVSPLGTCGS